MQIVSVTKSTTFAMTTSMLTFVSNAKKSFALNHVIYVTQEIILFMKIVDVLILIVMNIKMSFIHNFNNTN